MQRQKPLQYYGVRRLLSVLSSKSYGHFLPILVFLTFILVRKINPEQRFMFAYTTLGVLPTSFLAKGIMVAFF
tara:strand:+ start:435 stop:653 length:219 start_codon:yes stop_codon:yes gene_type:complete